VGFHSLAHESLGLPDVPAYRDDLPSRDENVLSPEPLGGENLCSLDESKHGLRLMKWYIT